MGKKRRGILSYAVWKALLTTRRVSGALVHDARMAIMKTNGITKIVIFNVQDFIRFSEIEAVHPDQHRLSGRSVNRYRSPVSATPSKGCGQHMDRTVASGIVPRSCSDCLLPDDRWNPILVPTCINQRILVLEKSDGPRLLST